MTLTLNIDTHVTHCAQDTTHDLEFDLHRATRFSDREKQLCPVETPLIGWAGLPVLYATVWDPKRTDPNDPAKEKPGCEVAKYVIAAQPYQEEIFELYTEFANQLTVPEVALEPDQLKIYTREHAITHDWVASALRRSVLDFVNPQPRMQELTFMHTMAWLKNNRDAMLEKELPKTVYDMLVQTLKKAYNYTNTVRLLDLTWVLAETGNIFMGFVSDDEMSIIKKWRLTRTRGKWEYISDELLTAANFRGIPVFRPSNADAMSHVPGHVQLALRRYDMESIFLRDYRIISPCLSPEHISWHFTELPGANFCRFLTPPPKREPRKGTRTERHHDKNVSVVQEAVPEHVEA